MSEVERHEVEVCTELQLYALLMVMIKQRSGFLTSSARAYYWGSVVRDKRNLIYWTNITLTKSIKCHCKGHTYLKKHLLVTLNTVVHLVLYSMTKT